MAPSAEAPGAFPIAQVARKLNTSTETIRRGCIDRSIPAFKVRHQWRVRADVVEALMNGQLQEFIESAPPLTTEQAATIRAAFQRKGRGD